MNKGVYDKYLAEITNTYKKANKNQVNRVNFKVKKIGEKLK